MAWNAASSLLLVVASAPSCLGLDRFFMKGGFEVFVADLKPEMSLVFCLADGNEGLSRAQTETFVGVEASVMVLGLY